MKKSKVVIKIQDGIVQAVHSETELDVTVIDIDDQAEEIVHVSELHQDRIFKVDSIQKIDDLEEIPLQGIANKAARIHLSETGYYGYKKHGIKQAGKPVPVKSTLLIKI